MDWSLGFANTLFDLLAVTGVMLNPEHLVMFLAGPVSHSIIQCMDFIEIFNLSLDFSTVYFAHFSGCSASFVCSCYSILECPDLFSGVKLSIRSFCFI